MNTQEILTFIAENISQQAATTISADQKLSFCDPRGNEYRSLNKKITIANAKREVLESIMDQIMTANGEEICVQKEEK